MLEGNKSWEGKKQGMEMGNVSEMGILIYNRMVRECPWGHPGKSSLDRGNCTCRDPAWELPPLALS